MALLRFANGFQTTLAGNVDGTTDPVTITLNQSYPNLVGDSHILIDNELLRVTAGMGTTSITASRAAEGTIKAAHTAPAAVNQIVTAGAFNSFIQATLSGSNWDLGGTAGLIGINGLTVSAGAVSLPALSVADAAIAALSASKLTGTTLPASIVTSSLTTVGILASPHMTGAVVDSGGLTVTAGGLTVSAGILKAAGQVNLSTGSMPANVGVLSAPAVTATTATTSLSDFGGTVTAHANSDVLVGEGVGLNAGLTFAKSTFTGLTAYGAYINGAGFAQSGAGTIATAYGLYVGPPTIGTNNIGARIDGRVGFGNDANATSPFLIYPTTTAVAASTDLIDIGGSITAHANSDVLVGVGIGAVSGSFTFAKGGFTGLSVYGLYVGAASFVQSGAGTIANAYGMRLDMPIIGTANYGLYISGTSANMSLDATTGNALMIYNLSTVTKAYVGLAGSAGAIIPNSATGDFLIRTQSQSLRMSLDGGTTEHIRFTTGGQLAAASAVSPGNFGTLQTANGLWQGSGVPANGNGANGDLYFRTDTPGTANQRVYMKSAGAWIALTL